MAYEPTNYANLIGDPPSPTAGIDAFRQEQNQNLARQLAATQIQAQLHQQALQQAALQDAITNPSTQSYNNYLLVNPAAHEAIQAAHNNQDVDSQRQQLQDLTAVQGYLGAKRPDDALAVVQKHIDAAKRGGQDPSAFYAIQKLIQSDPDRANALVGITLAGTSGADKMASTYSTMGKEGREQASFPLDQAGKVADINLKNAQAASAGNETEVNPATGAYYNKKAPPPAAALPSNNGALDNVVQQLIQSESAGVADAKNPKSSATGAGQFLSGTWAPLIAKLHPDLVAGKSPQEILDLRKNPQLAAEATAAYAQDNAQALGSAGLPVNGATIAMAHRLGPGDAQAVLKAQANTPLAQILSPEVVKANPQYAKMTAGQLGQQLARQFGTTALDTNPGDPNASGEDFLRTLAPARANQIRAIANGDLPLPTGRSAASGPGQFLAQQVLQYDPTASTINLQTRQATRKAFTSGTQGQSIVQANTVGGHLAALDGLADALHNGNMPLVNAVGQAVQTGLGDTTKQKAVTSFNTLSNTLASELTKFYRSNGGSEADVKEFRSQLNPTNSPTQIHAAIQQMAGAVLSKIGALNDSYNSGMGKVTEGLNLPNVNHNAISQLQRLAGDSSLGGGQTAQTSAPVVATNAQGQRVVYDAASRTWKPG